MTWVTLSEMNCKLYGVRYVLHVVDAEWAVLVILQVLGDGTHSRTIICLNHIATMRWVKMHVLYLQACAHYLMSFTAEPPFIMHVTESAPQLCYYFMLAYLFAHSWILIEQQTVCSTLENRNYLRRRALNGSAMARHGLIFCRHGAAG